MFDLYDNVIVRFLLNCSESCSGHVPVMYLFENNGITLVLQHCLMLFRQSSGHICLGFNSSNFICLPHYSSDAPAMCCSCSCGCYLLIILTVSEITWINFAIILRCSGHVGDILRLRHQSITETQKYRPH